ncbi:MAG: ABC transporter substrate-binding protein [Spirochaetes bacterium]|nr:ABC transporter substrate-binding protein [Spirochaetota bacterium]
MILFLLLLSISLYSINKTVIYAPSTPTSLPLLIASEVLSDTEVVLYVNHSQANALFLKGDVQIISTGFSVGKNFFDNKVPVIVINSYVSGLTHLVTYGKHFNNFTELKGSEIYLPFQNSPIEEITKFFILSEGLKWGDFKPVYSQFQSSVELLKNGKAKVVPLAEPFVSIVEKNQNIKVSFSYYDRWVEITGNKKGYPQTGTFIKKQWAEKNSNYIKKLNNEIKKAVIEINNNPEKSSKLLSGKLNVSDEILLSATRRTVFNMLYSKELKNEIEIYYKAIGKPLNENYKEFFYIY